MKAVIEKVENGFVLEVDVYTLIYNGPYAYTQTKAGTKRIIAADLLDVFKELNKIFP